MKPYELLRHLIVAEGLSKRLGYGSLPLAKRIGNPGLQSQIHKFMAGNVQDPERVTIEPIAELFRVPWEAFYKEEIATEIARDRGFVDDIGLKVSEPVPPYSKGSSLDQPVSLHTRSMASQVIEWRDIVKKLPKAFKVAAPDDAMADEWLRGELAEFEAVRPDLQPEPGDIVLVVTKDKVPLARRYTEPVDGRWLAEPDRKAYRSYWSDEHGLQIVAIFFGVRRRSGRTRS